ncbi:efflux RND transporter periplasmic adaptor subunit [Paenibacillus sp. SC116]|uniref:efflux RND transporter periplasmic adaptor subunit n=1 Tax=Paenibacillus sp. SC116 TaxID=2968986 RepID=UPI00215B4D08|nr:efflux RND transporter periplasmic adaptor subunit [Paenibacillus sp. SC116]MCR8844458.1 efflux RND transporter periplasmic adaptor subunit [Paenibacillus sp. SC116]
MEIQPAEQALISRKRTIRILFGLFIGLLIGFTLFSNTLKSLTLPKVALITVEQGELVHTFKGGGTVKWRMESALSGAAGGKVKQVNVKVGDLVKKGQALVVYDTKDIENQILDEKAALDKLTISTKELENRYIEAYRNGDEMSIEGARNDLAVSSIDKDVLQRKIQKLQEDLSVNGTLTAPFSGIVTKVGAVEGVDSTGEAPEIVIANQSLGFDFEFLVPADAIGLLEKGAKLDVQLSGSNARQIEGRIEEIQDAEPLTQPGEGAIQMKYTAMKRLIVVVQDAALQGGERADVELTKTTKDVILVDNKAIHNEGDKTYIFGMEERTGPLGNAFYVRKQYITIIDSNETQSAVTEGIFSQQQIILESSDPLQEGDKIRVH